jgi:hypothetical protein
MLAIGTVGLWIVGAPGPDYDLCVVAGYTVDNKYIIRHKVFGKGPWYESITSEVYPYTGSLKDSEYLEHVELGHGLADEHREQTE